MPTENTKVLVVLDYKHAQTQLWRQPGAGGKYPDWLCEDQIAMKRALEAALDAEQEERVEHQLVGERDGRTVVLGPLYEPAAEDWLIDAFAQPKGSYTNVRPQSRTIIQLPDGGQYVGPWRDLEEGE